MAFELDPTKVIKFDYDKITARDLDDFEDATGGVDLVTFGQMMEAGQLDGADALRSREHRVPFMAFVWIALRRGYPNLTFDEVYDEIGIAEAGTVLELVKKPQATNGATMTVAKPPAQRGARRTQQAARST